jgi:serine/threonine protein kinase
LKPENIALNDGTILGGIKIIDFSISRTTSREERFISGRCGTHGFIAPEILSSDIYDFRADLYSCGIIMMI